MKKNFLKKLFFFIFLFWPFFVKAVSLLQLITHPADFFGRLAIAVVSLGVAALVYLSYFLGGLAIIFAAWIMEISMNIPIVNSWARDVGWTLTRNFVNMLFIIILAWIGIATILRFREYQTGRTLVRLLVVALLINFSPVLVGLVVDVSNIIVHYFVKGVTSPDPALGGYSPADCLVMRCNGRGGFFEEAGNQMNQLFVNLITFKYNTAKALYALLTFVGYGFFFMAAAFVFGLLAFLFLMRVIMFWILLVLAPLAFICYVLPGTQRYARMWWHQLTQWALVGVTAAFFVYLSFQLLNATSAGLVDFFGSVDDPATAPDSSLVAKLQSGPAQAMNVFETGIVTLISTFLPLIVVLVFLGFGIFAGFATGAMGATWLQTTIRQRGRILGRRVMREMRTRAQERMARMMPERTQRALARLATAQTPGAGIPGWRGRAIRAVTRPTLGPFWAIGRAVGRVGPWLIEQQIEEIERRKRDLRRIQSEERMFRELRAGTLSNRIAAFLVAHEKGWLEEMKKRGLRDEEILQLTRRATRIHPKIAEGFVKAAPELADRIAQALSEREREVLDLVWKDKEEQEKYKTFTAKITATLSPSDIEKLSRATLENSEVMRAIAKFWSGREIGTAARKFGAAFVDEFMRLVTHLHETLLREGYEGGYRTYNPKAWRYLETTAALELGLRAPEAPKKEGSKKEGPK